MHIRPFQPPDRQAVIELWSMELLNPAPHNDPQTALAKKLAENDDLLLVAEDAGCVVGTVMGGYDGHRGWMYSLTVHPDVRRQGIATALCKHLEQLLVTRGCQKLNLQVRGHNTEVIAFYEQLGFTVEDNVSLGKRLYDPA